MYGDGIDNTTQGAASGGAGLTLVRSAEQPQAAPEPRRMQRRIVTLALGGDYPDFHVTAWVNFPQSLTKEMQRTARDEQRKQRARRAQMERDEFDFEEEDEIEDTSANSALAGAMKRIIIAHDWVDFDGQPYPPADTDEFYEAVPTDLLLVAWRKIQAEVGKLPTKRNGR